MNIDVTISIHALLAESDQVRFPQCLISPISIHALLAESDKINSSVNTADKDFYPRSPCGERRMTHTQRCYVSIFLSTLSLRRATRGEHHANSQQEFLSTLSLRRATAKFGMLLPMYRHFYPRSPCGERLGKITSVSSGLNFYPRSPCGERHLRVLDGSKSSIISIHALLAESDCAPNHSLCPRNNFYPRSPCGERRVTVLGIQHRVGISIHALLAESDLTTSIVLLLPPIFLSTLSLRRATARRESRQQPAGISIHALLAESDVGREG